MLLETVGLLFLVVRDDVFHPRRTTSECNEHTYGMWRTMSREFNMDQLIRIVQKSNMKTDCIFDSSLRTHRSKDGLSGYQATFQDYVDSVRKSSMTDIHHGGMHVNTREPAVNQLWDDVQGIIEFSNAQMQQFLGLFGIEEGNGLSPFCCRMNNPGKLKHLITEFFKRPKKDTRGGGPLTSRNDADNDCDDGDDEIDPDDIGDEKDMEQYSICTNGPSPELIASHLSSIAAIATTPAAATTTTTTNAAAHGVDEVLEEDEVSVDIVDSSVVIGEALKTTEDSIVEVDTVQGELSHVDSGGSAQSYHQLMTMLDSKALNEIAGAGFELIQLLQLGKMACGSISSDSKFMARDQRWFRAKKRNNANSVVGDTNTENEAASNVIQQQTAVISRNSLIQLPCKRGAGEKNSCTTIEYYRVLGFFTKHYNKWYMAIEDEFEFTPNEPGKMKGIRFIAQLMQKRGSIYTQVKLEKEGEWGPKHVYCIKSLNDILPMGEQGTVVLDLFSH